MFSAKESNIPQEMPKIEVVEIYPIHPTPKKKKKILEAGTVHVHLQFKTISMDIKNINYKVIENENKQLKVQVFMPFRIYEKAHVPFLTFRNPEIWRQMVKIIIKEVKENLGS